MGAGRGLCHAQSRNGTVAGGCESLPLSESFPEMTKASPPHTAPGFPRSHDAGDFSDKSFTKCLLSANIGEHFLPSCSFGPWVGSSYSAVRATDTLTAVLSCVVFLSVCVCVYKRACEKQNCREKNFSTALQGTNTASETILKKKRGGRCFAAQVQLGRVVCVGTSS